MGAIYKGVHTETRKRVAIKLLSPVLAAIPTVRARFLDEARLTARVRHPHIIDVSDIGEDEGRSYFAMEMLEGEDLARRLQRVRKISAADAADIVRPVCDAVAEAHRRGITHRDLKPSNIFLSIRHGRLHPIVLDFGIAKHDGEANAADAAGVPARAAMFGTPYYLAPEQIADHRAAGPASDQYALGVILYECLTGYPPFGGDSLEAVTRAIAAGNPVPPSKRRSDIPPDLDAVVLRALSLDPKARFASVAELGKALLPFASSATGNTPTPIQRTPSSPAIDLEAATPSPFRRTLTPELQMVQARHEAANAAADDAADEVTNELTNPVTREPAHQATNEAVHEAAHEAAHEARNEAWFAAGEALGDGTGEAPRGRLGRSAEWSGTVESAASRKIRIGVAAGVALAGLVVLFVATRGGSSSAQRPESQPLPATAIVQSEPAPVKPPAENAAVPPAEDPPIAATPAPTAVLPAAPAPSEPPAAPPPSEPAVAAPPAPPKVAVQDEPPAAKPAAEPPAAKPAPEPLAAKPAPEPPAAVAVQSDPPPAAKPARASRPVEASRARKPAGSPRSRTSAGVRMHNGVPLLD
jgi:serine/threonine-protein kinase